MLGCRGDVDVDRTAATHDEELQAGRLLHDPLRERRMVGDAAGDSSKRLDHLLLGTRGLAHLGDIAKRFERKRSHGLGNVKAIGERTKFAAHQLGRDEVVSDQKQFFRHVDLT